MIKEVSICILLLVSSCCIAQQRDHRNRVIFDSDMGPDYDDVGAITMLHAFADSGYINILATIASTNYEGVAGVFNVFNTYFKKPDIPIGVPKKNGVNIRDAQHWSDSLLMNYPHSIHLNADVPEALEIYRKVLSQQPDNSVTIVTTGFFTNLSSLLQSGPDKYSKLNGIELVKKKVQHLVSMAGKFPSGSEFNIRIDAPASQYVFANWPTPILLSGFEIGWKIRTGLPLINNNSIQHSPVKDVFRICIPMKSEDKDGRMSWDETAVLVAVKGYDPFYAIKMGTMNVNKDGSNSWSDVGKQHAYLVEKVSPTIVQEVINKLMMHQAQ
jgi:inosine-uridine nucleoside N-ribohydrolase